MGGLFIFVAVAWVACGILHAGWCFAYFQGKYRLIADENRGSDRLYALVTALFGLACIPADISMGLYRYGWRLW